MPEHGDRYVSVMIVNQDHYINEIFHDPGVYELSVDRHDTPYVFVAARVLVDPNDTNDLAAVAAIQDGFGLTAKSAQPFVMPDYDEDSFDNHPEGSAHPGGRGARTLRACSAPRPM